MRHPNTQDPPTSPIQSPITSKPIEQRAYELFVERGSTPGWDLQDWLMAEEEFKSPGQAAMSR